MDGELAEMGSRNCEMSSVKCELGTANCCFALKLAIVTVTGASWRQLHSFGCLLERLGSQLDPSWSRLRASRTILGAFWTVLGWLLDDNMISDVKIHDFGGRFGHQNRRKIDLGWQQKFESFWTLIYG